MPEKAVRCVSPLGLSLGVVVFRVAHAAVGEVEEVLLGVEALDEEPRPVGVGPPHAACLVFVVPQGKRETAAIRAAGVADFDGQSREVKRQIEADDQRLGLVGGAVEAPRTFLCSSFASNLRFTTNSRRDSSVSCLR